MTFLELIGAWLFINGLVLWFVIRWYKKYESVVNPTAPGQESHR